MTQIEAPIKEGDILADKYRVERVLGAGGMGIVVAAKHIVLNDHVAIKLLHPGMHDDTVAARFLREAQSAVQIKSPHVARVLDVNTDPVIGTYMVMEYLEGQDLESLIADEGGLDVGLACLFALQACEALAAAHAKGIIHRDVKPANLFVTRTTEGTPTIKMLDFGISKVTQGSGMNLTQTQTAMGSPLYMSPEQMRSARNVDPRTDIWSLGVVLYEALTGAPPYNAESMAELCMLVLETDPPPMSVMRPDVPPQLEAAVRKALSKRLEDRYQSVAEFAADLAPFAGDAGYASAGRVARITSGSAGETGAITAMSDTSAGMAMKQGARATNLSFGRTAPAMSRAVPSTQQPRRSALPTILGLIAALGVGGAVVFFVLVPAAAKAPASGEAPSASVGPVEEPPPAASLAAPVETAPPPATEAEPAASASAAPSATDASVAATVPGPLPRGTSGGGWKPPPAKTAAPKDPDDIYGSRN